jgi:hypothetical protein
MDTGEALPVGGTKSPWNDESSKDWDAMLPTEQVFCNGILHGKNKTKAYQAAFPDASLLSAGAAGSRMFKNDRVKKFLNHFRDGALEDLFITRNSLRAIAAGEVIESEYNGTVVPIIPSARDMTAASVQLAKLSGLNAPEKVQDDRFALLLQHMQARGQHGKEAQTGSA